MVTKNLHDEPFDESTIFKLEIFEDYAQAWIPTFVMQTYIETIHIFDFFAGTGYDKNGIPGSPIRILEKIKDFKEHIFNNRIKMVVHLNEFEPKYKRQEKFNKMQESCTQFMTDNNGLSNWVSIKYYNEDFETLFPKLLPIIKQFPSLVYLDQNGIKFLSKKYLLELENIKQTDFLYFVSSSYIWRFGDEDEFKKHLDIDLSEAKKQKYNFIHQHITEALRKKLPIDTKLKLYPFSLKKGANIHGIIFGSSHPLGVDKFLSIGWKRNGINGNANFDIDDDALKGQVDIFKGKKYTKIEKFKMEVETRLLSKNITNNGKLLEFVYSQGHIPKHATDCLKKLKKEGKILYDARTPLVSYDNVYRKRKTLNYNIVS